MDDIRIEKIVRSRRRTIALIITPDARLIIRAPLRASDAMIDAAIREKSGWILKKICEIKKQPQATIHTYKEGEIFWFLGRPYPLQITDNPGAGIQRTDRLSVPRTIRPDIRRGLQHWYMTEAYKEIHSRCMWFSMMTGYSPTSVRITDASQRWGSCNHKGGLNFSWRLIQAPLEIVDYVIVHELVHLRQPDHSRKFWEKVEALMPDYRRRREWLRENERLLRI
jgi:predicted metal-dependent hydrolase